jgi:hypothetical protein
VPTPPGSPARGSHARGNDKSLASTNLKLTHHPD